jgi:tetratricopeptide (TPR) repeat protein
LTRNPVSSDLLSKTASFALGSFILVGWLSANGAQPQEVGEIYGKAFGEFDADRYEEALQDLDTVDARATLPKDKAEALNLRGVILMRQCEYESAELVLERAIEIQPNFWNATFNLAEIPFLKRDWPEARRRFEAMITESPGIDEEARQLLQYKILLTHLLEGNEEMADRILRELQRAKGSPAAYYARAAIARAHEERNAAQEAIAAAAEHFPEASNKLYAESFYEIGWEKKPAGVARERFEILPPAERAAQAEAEATLDFERAESAFQLRDINSALVFLDRHDERLPNQAVSLNLRGEILMAQKKLDEAEVALRQALAADPKLREAAYNLAQVAFQRKQYRDARDQLERLYSETPGGAENQAAQLLKFEIFLTFLLVAQESEAQQLMEQFEFTGETPALYYAQAAWAFEHANPERGNDWVASARKIYSPALNLIFAHSFYDLGWLENEGVGIESGAETRAAMEASSPDFLSTEEPVDSLDWKPEELLSLNRWSRSEGIDLAGETVFSDAPTPLAFPNESEAVDPLQIGF